MHIHPMLFYISAIPFPITYFAALKHIHLRSILQ